MKTFLLTLASTISLISVSAMASPLEDAIQQKLADSGMRFQNLKISQGIRQELGTVADTIGPRLLSRDATVSHYRITADLENASKLSCSMVLVTSDAQDINNIKKVELNECSIK